jgi:hypothetical protein
MAYTDRADSNYLGELFLIGANQTPFLNMMGGLTGGGKISRSFQFPVAQPWALASASQDVQDETESAAAGTATTITRAQDYNTCQIMKKDVAVTFVKEATTGEFAGIQVQGNQPVTSELAFQQNGQLRQLAIDIEYSFLNGVFTDVSGVTTEQATRGAITATTTSAVNASSATLSKALVDNMMRTAAGNGAIFSQPVIFCNAFQKQKLSDIYGYAPTDRMIGGVNIQTIWTDFAEVGVVYAPQVPAATLFLADMSVMSPVFVPTEGDQVHWEETAITAAKKGGFFMTVIGIDYGPEEYHAKITSLATS